MTLDFPDLFQVNEVNCDAWTFVRLRLCQTSHKIRCIHGSSSSRKNALYFALTAVGLLLWWWWWWWWYGLLLSLSRHPTFHVILHATILSPSRLSHRSQSNHSWTVWPHLRFLVDSSPLHDSLYKTHPFALSLPSYQLLSFQFSL